VPRAPVNTTALPAAPIASGAPSLSAALLASFARMTAHTFAVARVTEAEVDDTLTEILHPEVRARL
jgi:hypothetical protein